MSALSSVWQYSDDSLCNHLGCGKDVCLGVVVGSFDLKTGREEGDLMLTSHLPHPSRLGLTEL